MKIGHLRNMLMVMLFTLAFVHLVKADGNGKLDAKTVKGAKDASKIGASLGEASGKASKFSKIINSGLSTYSTYVYGITATMAVIDFIWPGLIPEADPAYVAEMRKYFEELKDEFRQVKDQINDLKLYVQEKTSSAIYANYIITIHTMEHYFDEFIECDEENRNDFAKSYVDNYDQLGNDVDKLYTGLTITDDDLNIGKNAIAYTKGNRTKVLEILFEMLNVITMGIKHEALYYRLKEDLGQITVLQLRWDDRMNNLQLIMKEIDDQLVDGAKDQIEKDFDEEVYDLKDNSNSVMANNLYDFFKEKYYWKDWLVIVYSKSVGGFDNHAYITCGGNTVFRKRLGGGVDKTIYMFHVDKASGSWMTKDYAISKLQPGPWTYTGTCTKYEGRRPVTYKCQKAQNNLAKTIDAVKSGLKVCGVTKGVVLIKKGKGEGVAGVGRMKAHLAQRYFNAYAIGPYGSSSPQESVEGYSINGGWTSYTPYTPCSATCGGGRQTKTRYCRNPAPQDGGRSCSGSSTHTKSCNTHSCFSRTYLTNEIKDQLSAQKRMNNEDFAEHLRDRLKIRFNEHRFSVNVYDPCKGSDKHSMQGYSYVSIFRQDGRNVVVGYTKKTSSVPNSARLKEIESKVANAIKNKGKDAKKSRELAWEEVKGEGYRVAMVLVVRFGNGLRSRSTGGGIFFENVAVKGSSKSSLVVMLGRA